LDSFKTCSFLGCHQYLEHVMTEHLVTKAEHAELTRILPFRSAVPSNLPLLAKRSS
jgi:hypothetical protein